MNSFRSRKRLQSSGEKETTRTPTSTKNQRADAEMARKSTTERRNALASTIAVSRNETKTRAATGSEIRIKTGHGPKSGTERRTETGTGIENGRRTKKETEIEQETGILTGSGTETGINGGTRTKRESGTKKGKRGTKMERVATRR